MPGLDGAPGGSAGGGTAPTGGLLAVHAHPDDETLTTGALLATWAAAGRPVTVVTSTRGERGEVIGRRLAHLSGDPAALAEHRRGEVRAALSALGVDDHLFLDELGGERWTDSGMVWVEPGVAGPGPDLPEGAFVTVDVELAASRLATVITSRRPDVVVCDEPGGGYGHPDHVHTHRVTMRAVELAAAAPEPWVVPCVLWSALDGQALRAAAAELGQAVPPGTLAPDPDAAAPSAVVPPVLVDVRVDVAPVLGAVAAALRAHATQVQVVAVATDEQPPALPAGVLGRYALSNAVVRPVLADEAYRAVRGMADVAWPAGVTVR